MKISLEAELSVTTGSDMIVICFVTIWEGLLADVPVIVTVKE